MSRYPAMSHRASRRAAGLLLSASLALGSSLGGPLASSVTSLLPATVRAQEYSLDGTATTTDDVNLRSGPGTGFPVRLVVPAGSTVTTHGGYAPNHFVVVTYDGVDGYIHEDYLDSEPVQPTVSSQGHTTDDVYLRTGPGVGNSAIMIVPANSPITVYSDTGSNGFIRVAYDGTTGYMSVDYIASGPATTVDPEAGIYPGDPKYAKTTDDVTFRVDPFVDSTVIDVLPAGTTVRILPNLSYNGFTAVEYQGQKGYILTDYLQTITHSAIGETRTVLDDVRFRTGPGTDFDILRTLWTGEVLTVVDGPSNGFLKLRDSHGITGWASAQYLGEDGNSAPAQPTTPPPTSTRLRGWTNDSVYFRTGPGSAYSINWVLPEGTEMTVTGTPVNGFYPVIIDGTSGYVSTAFVDFGNPVVHSGDSATTNDRMNFRTGPSTSNSVIMVIPAGARVTITGAAVDGFYPVSYDGVDGWIYGLGLNS